MYLTVLGFNFTWCGINWSAYLSLNIQNRKYIEKKISNWFSYTWVCLELTVDIFDDSDVWLEFEHESLCADEAGEKPISR